VIPISSSFGGLAVVVLDRPNLVPSFRGLPAPRVPRILFHLQQELSCSPLGTNSDLSRHILHVEIASQFCVGSNSFRFIADFLCFIDTMSGSNGFSGSIVAD